MTSEMSDMFFAGGLLAIQTMALPILWAVAASIINRGLS